MHDLSDYENENDDTLVTYGGQVKALGGGKIGGYLVRFSTDEDPDMEGEFFTKDTDFGDASSGIVYYQHGMDKVIGKRRLGKASHKIDDFGVWAETQLDMRDKYEAFIYGMAEKDKMGWSSGTAGHLVERENRVKAVWLKSLPLGLDDTFYVRRQPQTGNLGKITYRGVLTEGDSVVSAQGLKQLNPASDLAVGGELWVEARALIAVGLSDWRDQGQDEWAFAMIHRNTSETVVARPMVNFVPGGIRPMQLKKKHYNRSSSRLTKTAKETNNVLASIQEQLNIINKKLGLVD